MRRAPFVHIFILIAFLFNTFGPLPGLYAQEFRLPVPGALVHLSSPLEPPLLKGIKIHPDNPFRFDFILDKGNATSSQQEQLKQEAFKLIKYFLASLTIPEKDLWVNLSPYEKDRIIPQSFGLTEMGRDPLAEDYMLKQITASLIYPEYEVGKKFWKRVYAEAARRYGTTNVPVNTFNKVWIVPEKAVVYENAKAGTAYVVESKLKVMLEQDYLAMQKGDRYIIKDKNAPVTFLKNTSALGSQIVREIVIPELTREVNENKNFAQLRQVYNSLILATWYKKKIRSSILEQIYTDKNKTAGVQYTSTLIPAQERIQFKNDVEGLYQEYLKAFKKGVYNYIKEEIDPVTQETIPRKYFSGGIGFSAGGQAGELGIKETIQPANPRQVVRAIEAMGADRAMRVEAGVADTENKNISLAQLYEQWKKKLAEDPDFLKKMMLPKFVENPKDVYSFKKVEGIDKAGLLKLVRGPVLRQEDLPQQYMPQGFDDLVKTARENNGTTIEQLNSMVSSLFDGHPPKGLENLKENDRRIGLFLKFVAFIDQQAGLEREDGIDNLYLPRDMGFGWLVERALSAVRGRIRSPSMFYLSRASLEGGYGAIKSVLNQAIAAYGGSFSKASENRVFWIELRNRLIGDEDTRPIVIKVLGELKRTGILQQGRSLRVIDTGYGTFPSFFRAILTVDELGSIPDAQVRGIYSSDKDILPPQARDLVISNSVNQRLEKLSFSKWRLLVRRIFGGATQDETSIIDSLMDAFDVKDKFTHPFFFDENTNQMIAQTGEARKEAEATQLMVVYATLAYQKMIKAAEGKLRSQVSPEALHQLAKDTVYGHINDLVTQYFVKDDIQAWTSPGRLNLYIDRKWQEANIAGFKESSLKVKSDYFRKAIDNDFNQFQMKEVFVPKFDMMPKNIAIEPIQFKTFNFGELKFLFSNLAILTDNQRWALLRPFLIQIQISGNGAYSLGVQQNVHLSILNKDGKIFGKNNFKAPFLVNRRKDGTVDIVIPGNLYDEINLRPEFKQTFAATLEFLLKFSQAEDHLVSVDALKTRSFSLGVDLNQVEMFFDFLREIYSKEENPIKLKGNTPATPVFYPNMQHGVQKAESSETIKPAGENDKAMKAKQDLQLLRSLSKVHLQELMEIRQRQSNWIRGKWRKIVSFGLTFESLRNKSKMQALKVTQSEESREWGVYFYTGKTGLSPIGRRSSIVFELTDTLPRISDLNAPKIGEVYSAANSNIVLAWRYVDLRIFKPSRVLVEGGEDNVEMVKRQLDSSGINVPVEAREPTTLNPKALYRSVPFEALADIMETHALNSNGEIGINRSMENYLTGRIKNTKFGDLIRAIYALKNENIEATGPEDRAMKAEDLGQTLSSLKRDVVRSLLVPAVAFGISQAVASGAQFSETTLPYGYDQHLVRTERGDSIESIIQEIEKRRGIASSLFSPQDIKNIAAEIMKKNRVVIKNGSLVPGQDLDIESGLHVLYAILDLNAHHMLGAFKLSAGDRHATVYLLAKDDIDTGAYTVDGMIVINVGSHTNLLSLIRKDMTKAKFNVVGALEQEDYGKLTDSQIILSEMVATVSHEFSGHEGTMDEIKRGVVRLFSLPVTSDDYLATHEISGELAEIAGAVDPRIPFARNVYLGHDLFYMADTPHAVAGAILSGRMLTKLHFKAYVLQHEKDNKDKDQKAPRPVNEGDLSSKIIEDLKRSGVVDQQGNIVKFPIFENPDEFKLKGKYSKTDCGKIYRSLLHIYNSHLWQVLDDYEKGQWTKTINNNFRTFLLDERMRKVVAKAANAVHKDIYGISIPSLRPDLIPDSIRERIIKEYFPNEIKAPESQKKAYHEVIKKVIAEKDQAMKATAEPKSVTIGNRTMTYKEYQQWIAKGVKGTGFTYEEAKDWYISKIKENIMLPMGFWDNEVTARNYLLAVLDSIGDDNVDDKGKFEAARRTGDVKTMADLYRKYVLDYKVTGGAKLPDGQIGFFRQKGGVAGLMVAASHPKPFLEAQNKPSALVKFALPELVDQSDPDALRIWEIEYSWDDPEISQDAILYALDPLHDGQGKTFKEFRLAHNVKGMADIYRAEVIGYKATDRKRFTNGQIGFFREKGRLAGLMASVKPKLFLEKQNSPAALLKFALFELVDQSNPDALRLNEIAKDAALTSTGGIDLTPANMNLQTQNSNGDIKFHLDPVMLAQLKNTPGFVPVIINIQPMTDLRQFLGLQENLSATAASV